MAQDIWYPREFRQKFALEGQRWVQLVNDRLSGTGDSAATLKNLFNANTILKADTDNTPEPLSVPEQTLIGRITGGEIDALTASEGRTLLALGALALGDTGDDVPVSGFTGTLSGQTDVQSALDVLDAAAKSPWELIERSSFSASSSESIGGAQTPSDFDAYRLIISNVVVSTDAVLNIWGSIDGGVSKLTGYQTAGDRHNNDNTHADFGTSATVLSTTSTVEATSTNYPYGSMIDVVGPGSTTKYKMAVVIHQWDEDPSTVLNAQVRHNWIETTSAVDSFIMEPASGNITGAWSLLGLRQTP